MTERYLRSYEFVNVTLSDLMHTAKKMETHHVGVSLLSTKINGVKVRIESTDNPLSVTYRYQQGSDTVSYHTVGSITYGKETLNGIINGLVADACSGEYPLGLSELLLEQAAFVKNILDHRVSTKEL